MQSLRYQNLSGLERRRYGTRKQLKRADFSHYQPLLQFVVSASSSSNSSPSPSTSASPTKRDYRVSLFDALKFNGPAPELINGRLAMLGLVAGVWQEAHSGATLVQQVTNLPLSDLLWLSIWVYASLVPILKGAKMEAFGWFTPRAEMTNGRAAMLGIAVLLLLEYTAGVPCYLLEHCIPDGVEIWAKELAGTSVSWGTWESLRTLELPALPTLDLGTLPSLEMSTLPKIDLSTLDLSTFSSLDLSKLPKFDLSTLPSLDPSTLSSLDLSTLRTLLIRKLDLMTP